MIFSSSSFSSPSDGVVGDELVVEEEKGGEVGSPSRLEKEGVRSTLPAQDIIRRLPDSGGGDVSMRRLLTVAGAAADVEEVTGAIDLCDFPACIFKPDSVLNDLSHWSHCKVEPCGGACEHKLVQLGGEQLAYSWSGRREKGVIWVSR